MPTDWIVYACLFLGLSSALVGGVFQAFSDFVMRGLMLAQPAGGIDSMAADQQDGPGIRVHRLASGACATVRRLRDLRLAPTGRAGSQPDRHGGGRLLVDGGLRHNRRQRSNEPTTSQPERQLTRGSRLLAGLRVALDAPESRSHRRLDHYRRPVSRRHAGLRLSVSGAPVEGAGRRTVPAPAAPKDSRGSAVPLRLIELPTCGPHLKSIRAVRP